MRIIVPIKQVPETSQVKMDPASGTMIRDGVESIVNPLDLFAIEAAVSLIEAHGGAVTALSMGPQAAEKALREAMAMGCDGAVLLCDRAFAGADTWATANVLAAAVRKLGEYDLILCGERATDGDTAQVGPELAAALDAPLATYVSHIETVDEADRTITVRRLTDVGSERLALPLPALLTVVREAAFPRLPTLRGKQRARSAALTIWGAQDLGLPPQDTGLKGSPTRVVKIESPRVTRGGEMHRVIDEASLDGAVSRLAAFLRERNLI